MSTMNWVSIIDNEISRRKIIEMDLALSNARLHAMVNFSHCWECWEEPNGKSLYLPFL